MAKSSMREAVVHGESLFPFQIYAINLSCGIWEGHLHWHPEMEIIYVERGKIRCQADFQSYYLQAGEILVIPKGELHHFQEVEGEDVQVWAFVFDLNLLSASVLDRGYLTYIEPIQQEKMSFKPYIQPNAAGYEQLQQHLIAILASYREKPLAYELEIKSHLLLFVMQLFRHGYTKTLPKLSAMQRKKVKTIKEVIAYIEKYHHRPLSLDELAKVANYSEFHFARFFKQETGMTCIEYINNYRLERAAQALIQSDRPITELASTYGFDNVSYFIRCFKQKYEQTPAQFRKKAEW